MSTAQTCSPNALVYCTPKRPKPPMPEMTIHSLGRACVSLMPLHDVMPAQIIGAASRGARQNSQWPQAENSQGTPTRSCYFTAVTPAPSARTRPKPW